MARRPDPNGLQKLLDSPQHIRPDPSKVLALGTPTVWIIPVNYNDGTPIEDEVGLSIFDQITVLCGGFTAHRADGSWVRPDGTIQYEPVIRLSVTFDKLSFTKAVAVATYLGRLLKQQAIYMEHNGKAYLVPIQPEPINGN